MKLSPTVFGIVYCAAFILPVRADWLDNIAAERASAFKSCDITIEKFTFQEPALGRFVDDPKVLLEIVKPLALTKGVIDPSRVRLGELLPKGRRKHALQQDMQGVICSRWDYEPQGNSAVFKRQSTYGQIEHTGLRTQIDLRNDFPNLVIILPNDLGMTYEMAALHPRSIDKRTDGGRLVTFDFKERGTTRALFDSNGNLESLLMGDKDPAKEQRYFLGWSQISGVNVCRLRVIVHGLNAPPIIDIDVITPGSINAPVRPDCFDEQFGELTVIDYRGKVKSGFQLGRPKAGPGTWSLDEIIKVADGKRAPASGAVASVVQNPQASHVWRTLAISIGVVAVMFVGARLLRRKIRS